MYSVTNVSDGPFFPLNSLTTIYWLQVKRI
jgi:hypothetical protein